MSLRGSNHKTAAAWNRGLAIRLLRRHGTLSRHDLSRMTKLQGSTLSYIMRELLEKNLVRVVGKRESRLVGQKQVLLTLNPALGWTLGVALRPGLASLVLLDAAGGRIDGMSMPIGGALASLPNQLHDAMAGWLRRRGTPPGRMLGLGVAVPGVVDADAGVVLRSMPFHAVNVPLARLFGDRFGAPAIVDHDACFGAGAEAADGAAADASHFIYYSVDTTADAAGRVALDAYGSALFLQGRIYRGAFYGAGELSDPLEPATTRLADEELAALTDPEGAMPAALIELAARIGGSLGPMVNLVDVQLVVLAGTARIVNRRFIAAVQAVVTDRLVPIPGRAVRVVRSAWEPEAAARGAAIGAFDHLVAEGQLFESDDRAASQLTSTDPALLA